MGLSVTKVNGCSFYFVADSSVLDLVVVLAASLDINCLYMFFMIGVNSLFIEFVNMNLRKLNSFTK